MPLLLAAILACGSWRWSQKTLADRPDLASAAPAEASVEQIEAIDAGPVLAGTARLPAEAQLFHVAGWLVGYKAEADGDVHMAVIGEEGGKLIAEIPAAPCVSSPAIARAVAEARQAFLAAAPRPPGPNYVHLRRPIPIEIVGAYFADECTAAHHPTGAGQRCGEIHPVLSFHAIARR